MRDATERLVARRARELREALGLSRYEVARRAGIAVNQVSRIEALERAPSLSTLARLAVALEVPIGSFFTEGPIAPAKGAAKRSLAVRDAVERLEALPSSRRKAVLRALDAIISVLDE